MKINSLKFNNSTIHKMYHGNELVNKIGDAFTYMEASGDTPTPPTPVPYDEQYFTIESLNDNNTITWKASGNGIGKTISASTDNGSTWTEYTSSFNGTPIATLNTGDKVLVKGTNEAYAISHSGNNRFLTNENFIVYGNIMSLISGDTFLNADTLTTAYTFANLFRDATGLTSASNLILPATTLANNCYYQMFRGCTSLTTAPELPATTLAESCYLHMFYGCSSLTVAPELPATTLVNSCYDSMFYNCTSLVNAPELPATELAYNCYSNMFQGCTSLTTAPELPATTLENSCYWNMFRDCTRLTTAPELPATTVTNGCYVTMFAGCSSLNYIKCLATDISATNCTANWVSGVANSGTFVKAASMSSWATGANGIPTGWTVQNG